MSEFSVGSTVWWISIAGGNKIERAGYIVALVPAGTLPQEAYPDGITCKFRGSPRTHDSFIIRAPDVHYAFWPQIASLNPMTPDKEYILTSQPKSHIHFVRKVVLDCSDRNKLKELATTLGDSIVETRDMIEIKGWKSRFWFSCDHGVEFVISVDRW